MIAYFKNKSRASALRTARQKLKRKMGFKSFDLIKSVGIIVRYELDIENKAENKLFDFFKQKGIKIEKLVYYPAKKLPANMTVREGVLWFTEGDANWFGKPKSKEVENFINSEFDLLIDLAPEHVYSLQYIVQASRASFKVGRMSYENDPYDFVLVGNSNNDSKYVDDLFEFLAKIR